MSKSVGFLCFSKKSELTLTSLINGKSFGEFQNSFEDCLFSKIGLLISCGKHVEFDFNKRFRGSKILVNDHSSLRNKILYCLG